MLQVDSLKPPDIACAKHASKVSSSMTGWPLSRQTIFRASFSRSWWFAIATRFSKDAMARFKFGVTRMPSASARSPGVGGVFASENLAVLLVAPFAPGAALSAMPIDIGRWAVGEGFKRGVWGEFGQEFSGVAFEISRNKAAVIRCSTIRRSSATRGARTHPELLPLPARSMHTLTRSKS